MSKQSKSMDFDALSDMCNITSSTASSDMVPGENANHQMTRARKVPVFTTLPVKRPKHKKSYSSIPLLNDEDQNDLSNIKGSDQPILPSPINKTPKAPKVEADTHRSPPGTAPVV